MRVHRLDSTELPDVHVVRAMNSDEAGWIERTRKVVEVEVHEMTSATPANASPTTSRATIAGRCPFAWAATADSILAKLARLAT